MASKEWIAKNKDKMKEYRRMWYHKNKQEEQKKARHRQKSRRSNIKEWLDNYKATLKCERCGFSHPAALDFHHRDSSTKEFTIGSRRTLPSNTKTLKEIEKCEVLCSNCHRIHHYEERRVGSV